MALQMVADRNNIYIFPWYIADLSVTSDIKQITGLAISQIFMTVKDGFMTASYDVASVDRVGRATLDKLITDPSFFDQVIQNIYSYSAQLEAFSHQLEILEIEKLSNEDLVVYYESYVKLLRTLRAWGWIPVLLDGMSTSFLSDYLRDALRAVLIKSGQADKLLDYFTILGSSEKQSEIQQEELARLNLLLEITDKDILNDIEGKNIVNLSKSSVHDRLQKHLKDFGWLTYGYIGPVMSLEHLIDALADNLGQGDIAGQKNKIVSHYQDLKKNKEEIYGLINIPADLKRLFEISAELMFIKDYRKGIYQKSYVAMDKVMSEIAKRLDISLREVKFLIAEEVRTALLEGKKELYRGIAQKRSLQSCYLMADGKMDIYEGEAAEAMIKKMLPAKEDSVEDITELSGMVAYKGELTGIAKIVLTVEDIDKVEAGDILISSATNPDLILAMKKAAAFVTDMGGITSHAAIVARELKKPCLVGTKIATHVFKDGDTIHLDAINGLVRKL